MERYDVPYHLYLGSTPLSSYAIVGAKIAKQFKERNRIEVMNTIVLSDGGNTSDLKLLEGQYEENGSSDMKMLSQKSLVDGEEKVDW